MPLFPNSIIHDRTAGGGGDLDKHCGYLGNIPRKIKTPDERQELKKKPIKYTTYYLLLVLKSSKQGKKELHPGSSAD